ncbi:MAG: bifunctional phosphoribosylaminoimidazolecarboxamide formyltransferase/IMP cyclohydrolase [Rhodospirillales bacterium]|nr:bifunctional phosphoribosylaminoimidazolecarboxamide formyltransferase/IMP cyclohydrolase [Rhodospirillales bacterium]
MSTNDSQAAAAANQTIRDPRAIKIKRALISVTDKQGLDQFAARLKAHGVEILSTGGTAKMLREAGIDVVEIADYTGFPEIMDGRVKTLHPKVHGGILARRDKDSHQAAMQDNDIGGIDMVVVNLYAFSEVVAEGADYDTCVENIDIGGPAMIRASAKNHEFVTIVTDPQDYELVLKDMEDHDGATTYALRQKLAANALALTATYDANIASWVAGQIDRYEFPRRVSFSGNWQQTLRYGENPHQKAAIYADGSKRPGVVTATQLQGKELSYNNLNDTDAAFELVAEFIEPAVAIIKHANPCGVAQGKTPLEAYKKALLCDPVSAFGGIIALNRPLDKATAEEIIKVFSEVIIAPSVEADAIDVVKSKEKLRLLTTGAMPDPKAYRRIVKSLSGGLLVQDADGGQITADDLKVVTEREPTAQELEDMLFAFRVAKHVKSNAIVYAKGLATVGIGAGQMSRVDSTRIAAHKAQEAAEAAGLDTTLTKGSVVASDAFFPFPDGLLAAADAGATAVIQPGGSIRDEDIIAAADERGLAMVLTGMRHFRH